MKSCVGSLMGEHPAFQPEGSGANPTPTLHFSKHDWLVKDCELYQAHELIAKFHYSKGGSNTRVFTHGLYDKKTNTLCGVAWWIPPTKSSAQKSYPKDWKKVLSLSRLVIVPGIPKNACSFLVSKSILLIRRDARFECLVTYADDYQKHTGAIYKASGWEYLGKTQKEKVWVDQTGRMVARKSGPKTRTTSEMQALGYRAVGAFSKHKFRIIL